jgi:hypothetical protein
MRTTHRKSLRPKQDKTASELTRAHPEMANLVEIKAWENLTTGIWLIFRGLNFSRNADIGQISH